LVFTVLSFAGFEGTATLGEEVRNPLRNIPIAIVGTVILAVLSSSLSPMRRSSVTGSIK
jgi:amino acid transporter